MARILEKVSRSLDNKLTARDCACRLLEITGVSLQQVSFLEEALDNISECFTHINEKDCLLELSTLNKKYMGALSDVILAIRSLKFEISWKDVDTKKTYNLDSLVSHLDIGIYSPRRIVMKKRHINIEMTKTKEPVQTLYY